MVGGPTLHEGIWDFSIVSMIKAAGDPAELHLVVTSEWGGKKQWRATNPGAEKESEKQEATRNVSGFWELPGSKQPKTEKPQKNRVFSFGLFAAFFLSDVESSHQKWLEDFQVEEIKPWNWPAMCPW